MRQPPGCVGNALLDWHSFAFGRSRWHGHPLQRSHSQNAAESGRHPPVPVTDHRQQRRHEQRAHDRGVEQDAEAQRAREPLQVGARSSCQRVMRFLLDENLSPRLAALLRDAGHHAIRVRDIGLARSKDETVIETARAEDRVLVSADTDFGTLLARSRVTGPSFLLIRRASGRRAVVQAEHILENLPTITSDLEAGAGSVPGENTLRIRRLPIGSA